MKNLSICLICTITLMITGCVTRKFIISSKPERALIIQIGMITDSVGIEQTLTFIGKSDVRPYTAMKRGYHPDTVYVSKDSPAEINFELKRIDGASTIVNIPEELTVNNVNLLPVNVDIILHKGVGNLDKFVRSVKLSDQTYTNLNEELHKIKTDSTISLVSFPTAGNSKWIPVSVELEKYLKSLKPALLAFYPVSPSVNDVIMKNNEIFSSVPDSICSSGSKQYLVFAWCKSVKPTSGRIIGNVGVSIASGAVEGYQTAKYGYSSVYYDPSAFTLDYSTLFVAYIIDPVTGEVLDIKQHVVPYDITKEKYIQKFAKSVMMFPVIKPNKKP